MPYREQIAIDKGIDNTVSFLKEGYKYISNRTTRYGRNMFETKLLGGKYFVCMIGKDAAEIFYDNDKFKRRGAAPKRILQTLFGEGGVQTLDGKSHHNRKALFMSMMTKKRLKDMNEIVKKEWLIALKKWEKKRQIVVYEEAKVVLARSACIWVGVPLLNKEEEKRAKELGAMFEAGGAIGIRHMRGRIDRKNIEKWAKELITSVREGTISVADDTPLYKISFHKNSAEELLDLHTASVELANLLRPIVAVSVYVTFCALALHQFPEEREKLYHANKHDYLCFIQEVRRYYPFFPMVIAQVKDHFLWGGHDFKKNTYVLLDLYGTNHHSDLWEAPYTFAPERFIKWENHPFSFIPQGGGDYDTGHRCPGEWLTVNIMTVVVDMLVHQMTYDVPHQNLTYSMKKMPSLPKSKFIIKNVQNK